MFSFGGRRDAREYSNYGTHKTTNELQVLIVFNVLVSTYANFNNVIFTFKDEVDNLLPPIFFLICYSQLQSLVLVLQQWVVHL
jgi:hypothetical protein